MHLILPSPAKLWTSRRINCLLRYQTSDVRVTNDLTHLWDAGNIQFVLSIIICVVSKFQDNQGSRETPCLKIPNKQIKTKITNNPPAKPQTTRTLTTMNKTRQIQKTKAKPSQAKPNNQTENPITPNLWTISLKEPFMIDELRSRRKRGASSARRRWVH